MIDHKTSGFRPPADRLKRFVIDDAGAVTVDWVVLTAAVVGMGIAAGFSVSSGVPVLADKIVEVVESRPIGPD